MSFRPRAVARIAGTAALLAAPGMAFAARGHVGTLPWWAWPLILFVTTFLMGIVAVVGGIGGGVLFVPIVGGFFPFHLDFVRGAGLMLALCGALTSGPGLLRSGLASLRLAMPLALAGSVGGIVGALVGLALPTNVVQVALGVTVLLIAALMWWTRNSGRTEAHAADRWAIALGLHGRYHDAAVGQVVEWKVHRTAWGLLSFFGIGLVGGLFGLGAGWANVPALNLLMGVPLKLALGTSGLAISIINTSAAWVYMNKGALLPIIIVPSILGVMIGARVGVKVLKGIKAATARNIVIGVLLLAGLRSLLQGLGLWG
ncbi:MAG TPA: sulfite exporter TauE/SafE family protein [Usitatibacter sp.]|nr:sulfite exporter TauE/SafE family protein [Usitatibacter sp.]